MKILSFITGIGYGHTIRQAALMKYIKQKHGKFVIASYGNALTYFQNKYPTIDIHGPKFPEKSGRFGYLKLGFLNLKLFFNNISDYFKLQTTLKVFKPDIIISDVEYIALYLKKSIPHFLIFNFDPKIYQEFIKAKKKRLRLQKLYLDLVYNKAKKINCPIIIPSLLGAKKDSDYYYVNPILREIPKECEKTLLKRLNLDKQPIIIMFGGSYFGNKLLHKILPIISEIDENFLIFGYKLKGKKHKNITFLPFKKNFLEYLKVSKGIITMAGHNTLSECIVLKKPSLIFPIPNLIEQLTSAFIMEKNKLAIVKDPENISQEELKLIILKFLSNLGNLKKNLDKFNIKPNGAEQVYEIIKDTS